MSQKSGKPKSKSRKQTQIKTDIASLEYRYKLAKDRLGNLRKYIEVMEDEPLTCQVTDIEKMRKGLDSWEAMIEARYNRMLAELKGVSVDKVITEPEPEPKIRRHIADYDDLVDDDC